MPSSLSPRLPRPEPPDRACQFIPFAALKGYYDLLRERELVPSPRHELTDEEAAELSIRMARVRRRAMVTVTYYERDCYRTTTGLVSDIDIANRIVTVVRKPISFDDIVAIAGEGIGDDFAKHPIGLGGENAE